MISSGGGVVRVHERRRRVGPFTVVVGMRKEYLVFGVHGRRKLRRVCWLLRGGRVRLGPLGVLLRAPATGL